MKCKIHTYKRSKLGEKTIYKCIKCPSYIFTPLQIGQPCICYGCGNEFTISLKHIQVRPHCGCLTETFKNKYKMIKSNNPITPAEGNSKEELLEMLLKRVE